MKIRNTMIIFIVSGFWHGANWTFIIWGALNAIYFLPLLLTNRNRRNMNIVADDSVLPSLKEALQILATFGLTVLAWIFFRAENVGHASDFIGVIFSASLFSMPKVLPLTILSMTGLFFLIEWIGRKDNYAIEKIGFSWKKPVRWAFYFGISMFIFLFDGKEQIFIYFQF